MTKDEVLRIVREVEIGDCLPECDSLVHADACPMVNPCEAIRIAINALPEPEPVAWIIEDENWRQLSFDPAFREGTVRTTPLYAAPPSATRDAEDAERYRWLRGGPDIAPHSERWPRWEVRNWTGKYWDTLFAEELDAAIDAARKREGA